MLGCGKTTSITYNLLKLRKKYGNNILIFTNYPTIVSDYVFKSYKDICHDFNKPVVVGWDEIQNVFTQNDFKDFPEDLLDRLTQVRKGNGMKILYSTQDFNLITNSLRRLTDHVCECKTFKRRLTWYYSYRLDYFLAKYNSQSITNKLKVPADKKVCYIHTKKLHSSFNSFQRIHQKNFRAH